MKSAFSQLCLNACRPDLIVERVGAELHGAGDDGLGGDGVEDVPVLEEDESGHVGDDVAPLELLQVHDLEGGWK